MYQELRVVKPRTVEDGRFWLTGTVQWAPEDSWFCLSVKDKEESVGEGRRKL